MVSAEIVSLRLSMVREDTHMPALLSILIRRVLAPSTLKKRPHKRASAFLARFRINVSMAIVTRTACQGWR